MELDLIKHCEGQMSEGQDSVKYEGQGQSEGQRKACEETGCQRP